MYNLKQEKAGKKIAVPSIHVILSHTLGVSIPPIHETCSLLDVLENKNSFVLKIGMWLSAFDAYTQYEFIRNT